MNTPFNEYSAGDVARMLKVDKSTVANWCKLGKIESVNISKGPHNSRYLIPEKEVDYLRSLVKEYGSTRKALLHYIKREERPGEPEPYTAPEESEFYECEDELTEEIIPNRPRRREITIDEISLKIAQIKDIKERLNDIEAEKNQLMNELQSLRKEIMDFIN